MTIQQAFELAVQHHQAGRLAEADALYRQILAAEPRHADAMHLLGVIAHQMGRNEAAVDLIRQAIALTPGSPEFHSNFGEVCRATGQLDQAIAAFRQAIALKPNNPEAHYNLGNALSDKGQVDEAIAAFRQAIALKPNFPEAHSNLGTTLLYKGQSDEAMAAYRQAVTLDLNLPEAHNNLGNILRDKGQIVEAIAAYRQAVALRLNYVEAHYNLGNALSDKGRLDEAIAAYRQAINLKPDYAEAYSNMAIALRDKGQLDEALTAYRQAIALKPNYPEGHSNLLLALNYHPGFDAPAIAREQRLWNEQHAEPLRQYLQPHPNDRSPERRLRIGYVSPDFRAHIVGWNMLSLLAEHDRGLLEIFCYAEVAHPDAFTELLQGSAQHWRNTVGLTDEQLAARIRQDQIDILVDLALHTAHNRITVFARKPAPVQVTFAGYPGSTGLNTIDYRLSDPFLDPLGIDESLYSERTVRLPHSFWCYEPLHCGDIPVNDLPATTNGFITFGCLNDFSKINAVVLRLWAKLLHALPSSRLLLLAPEGSHREHALGRLGQEGIAHERIEFIARQPRRNYLELYHRIDLGLDTLPYNGHTTSLDSFWMGVPVVTLVGQTIVGRAGLSQLMNLKLPELIAHTPDQYVEIATALANDLPRLSELRGALRARMEQSPLMGTPRFAREIETAYRTMWRKWCMEKEPALP